MSEEKMVGIIGRVEFEREAIEFEIGEFEIVKENERVFLNTEFCAYEAEISPLTNQLVVEEAKTL